MSAFDEAAEYHYTSDEEREDYLDDVFSEIRYLNWGLRHGDHDRNGFFADEAGSDQCVALGHTESDWENDETHPMGWDGDPICEATKFGQACSACEGECDFSTPSVVKIWELPGVMAA